MENKTIYKFDFKMNSNAFLSKYTSQVFESELTSLYSISYDKVLNCLDFDSNSNLEKILSYNFKLARKITSIDSTELNIHEGNDKIFERKVEKYKDKYINACLDSYIDEIYSARLLNLTRLIFSNEGRQFFLGFFTRLQNENLKNDILLEKMLFSLKEFKFEELGKDVNNLFSNYLISHNSDIVLTILDIIYSWDSYEEKDFVEKIRDSRLFTDPIIILFIDKILDNINNL